MKNILNSATKIVFISLTLALIIGLFVGKVDQKDFFIIVWQVFAFYFSRNSQQTNQDQQTPTDTQTKI